MGFFDTLFGGGAQEDAAAANARALGGYQGTALPALKTGYDTGVLNLNNAVGAYAPLATLGQNYSKAGDTWAGALGLGGPAGTNLAQSEFTHSPGYAGGITAGTDAILRQLGASGMSQSGKAAEDVGTFTQNTQNKEYNTWLQNLQQMAGMGATATAGAAAGQAAGDTGLAGLGYQYGGDQAGVAGNVASGTMADNNMVAAGQAAGAKNLLGAGLSLATLGMGGNPFGGTMPAGGGTSLLGGLATKFSNNLFGGGSPSGYGVA